MNINDVVLTVGPGQPYASPLDALGAMNAMTLPTGLATRMLVSDGVYPMSAPFLMDAGFASKKASVGGRNTYPTNLLGVDSVSGAPGAWAIVLNLSDVSHIVAANYLYSPTPAGGVNPSHLAGFFKVTAVDPVTSKITIASTHWDDVPPSGAIAGPLTVIKTVFQFPAGTDGIQLWDGCAAVAMANVVIEGAAGGNGISIQDAGGRMWTGGPVGVVGFAVGVMALYGIQINGAAPLGAMGAQGDGMVFREKSVIADLPAYYSCGHGGRGVVCGGEGRLFLNKPSVISGNKQNGIYVQNAGSVFSPPGALTITGNQGWGAYADGLLAGLDIPGATFANNASGDKFRNVPIYATNAAALAGGLTVGDYYRVGTDPDVIAMVH